MASDSTEICPTWLTVSGGIPAGLLVVGIARTQQGWHIGLYHRRRPNGVGHLLHLEHHLRLRNDDPTAASFGRMAWVIPALDELESSSLAARCRTIAKKQSEGRIPYGFVYRGASFSLDGELELGMGELGLTCATFVLAVFKSTSIELVERQSWPIRDGDESFRDGIVEVVRSLDEEAAKALLAEPRCARFRPTEVAGATTVRPRPVTFVAAQQPALQVERFIPPWSA